MSSYGILLGAGDSDWTSVISLIANIGFAALVGWYLLTRAIPKMQEDHRVDLEMFRKEFLESLRSLEVEFAGREDRSHKDMKEAIQTVTDHCEKESALRNEVIKAELSLVTTAVQNQRGVLEEVRDVLRESLKMPRSRS